MMYRRLHVPTVWREMDRLQREMNRLFEDYTPSRQRAAQSYPALNVWTDQEGLTITAEVPGVRPEDLDISVVGDTLTLTGERKPEDVDGEVRYHRRERGHGLFNRTLQLPYQVDVSEVEASFKNGVLRISLPRAEEDKPRKIAVKTA